MYVYRCSSFDNYDNFCNGINSKPITVGKNTHHYKNSVSYVHFFRYSQFAKYFSSIWKKNSLFFVADIPNDILKQYFGFGFYSLDDFSVADESVFPMPEYAIPSFLLSSDFIVSVSQFIDVSLESNYFEYLCYFELLKDLGQLFQYDYDMVAKYLLENDYDSLIESKKKRIYLK